MVLEFSIVLEYISVQGEAHLLLIFTLLMIGEMRYILKSSLLDILRAEVSAEYFVTCINMINAVLRIMI